MRDAALGRERTHPLHDRAAARSRAVIGDVAADHDGVQAGQVAGVMQDALESGDGVDAVHVGAGRGDVGVGEMQDPGQGVLPVRVERGQVVKADMRTSATPSCSPRTAMLR